MTLSKGKIPGEGARSNNSGNVSSSRMDSYHAEETRLRNELAEANAQIEQLSGKLGQHEHELNQLRAKKQTYDDIISKRDASVFKRDQQIAELTKNRDEWHQASNQRDADIQTMEKTNRGSRQNDSQINARRETKNTGFSVLMENPSLEMTG